MVEVLVYLSLVSLLVGVIDHTVRTRRWLRIVREAFETWNPVLLEQQRRIGERDAAVAKIYTNISLGLLAMTVFLIVVR